MAENAMQEDEYEIRRIEDARRCQRMRQGKPCEYCHSYSRPMIEFWCSWKGRDKDGREYDETDNTWEHPDPEDWVRFFLY